MNEDLKAVHKYFCAACGAQAEWNPTKHALVCGYCGTVAPANEDPSTGVIREIDLVETLREMGEEERGWKEKRRSVKCQSCHAVSVFDADRVGQNCSFCGSPSLLDYEEIKAPLSPESLLPFKVDREAVYSIIKHWLGNRWFAPNNLKGKSLVDTLKGVYLSYWTFDAQAHCPWTAESGYYYYETESYRDGQGNQQTRQVRKTRWVPSSGKVDHFFDDVLIPGTRGVSRELLDQIEPFPTGELIPYDRKYLSGWVVEHYQIVLIEAAKQSRDRMDEALRQMCAREVPGDTHRFLKIYPKYDGKTFKYILAPVWLLAYDYGRKKYQVVVNGYTGAIAGNYPKSFWKIFFFVTFLLTVLGGIVWYSNR